MSNEGNKNLLVDAIEEIRDEIGGPETNDEIDGRLSHLQNRVLLGEFHDD